MSTDIPPQQMESFISTRVRTIQVHIARTLSTCDYVLVVTHPGRCVDPDCKECTTTSISSEFEIEGFASFPDLTKILKDYAIFREEFKDSAFDYTDDLTKLIYNNSIYARWGVFDKEGRFLKLVRSNLEEHLPEFL